MFPGRPRTEYRDYTVGPAEADKLPYPPPPRDFVKQLLTLQNPGDALVVKDRPASHFYVAVLLERSEPKLKEFNELYSQGAEGDALWETLMTQERKDYRERVLLQLRRETGAALDDKGKFVIPEDVGARFTGSGEDRE